MEVCQEVMGDLQEAVEDPRAMEDPQMGETQGQISHDPPIAS